MEKLLTILKSLTTNLAEGLAELKTNNVEGAVEKISKVVDICKEAETEAEAVKATAEGEAEAIEKTRNDNLALIEKIAGSTEALKVIEKWVNLGISGDKMEAVLSDINALSEAIKNAGGSDAILKSLEDTKDLKASIEKISKKVSISKQVTDGGEDEDEDEEGKKPVAKFKSFRGGFNRANGVQDEDDDDGE